jgi:hypothetical protein
MVSLQREGVLTSRRAAGRLLLCSRMCSNGAPLLLGHIARQFNKRLGLHLLALVGASASCKHQHAHAEGGLATSLAHGELGCIAQPRPFQPRAICPRPGGLGRSARSPLTRATLRLAELIVPRPRSALDWPRWSMRTSSGRASRVNSVSMSCPVETIVVSTSRTGELLCPRFF